ncbi:MAG: hypothetical protein RR398_03125 [Clostridia bacterium]
MQKSESTKEIRIGNTTIRISTVCCISPEEAEQALRRIATLARSELDAAENEPAHRPE